MYGIRIEFITGFSIGGEFVDKRDLEDGGEGWVLLFDLGIIRLLIEKFETDT